MSQASNGVRRVEPIANIGGVPISVGGNQQVGGVSIDSGNNEQIFVCTNKWCREKGSDATMATLSFLASPIQIVPVGCLGQCNKGPNVRLLTKESAFVECTSVRSVDAVVSLLEENLGVNVNMTAAQVLKLNYEGNVYLRDGEVDKAIDSYSGALRIGDSNQEGILLIMRGSALLQRAYSSRLKYKRALQEASESLPCIEDLRNGMLAFSYLHPIVQKRATLNILLGAAQVYKKEVEEDGVEAVEIDRKWSELRKGMLQWAFDSKSPLNKKKKDKSSNSGAKDKDKEGGSSDNKGDKDGERSLTADLPIVPELTEVTEGPNVADILLSRASFSFSLYEHSLIRALEDLLKATMVLPGFAQGWRRAGDALSELQHFGSAIEYYEIAIDLEPSLGGVLESKLERLRMVEKIISSAEGRGLGPDIVNALISDSVEF
jgi:tetratricopeptide (TPR) repeat protein